MTKRAIQLAAERAGLGVLGLVVLAISVHVWLWCSVFVPIGRDPAEFAFVSASFTTFLGIAVAAFAGLAAVHALVRWADRPSTNARGVPSSVEGRDRPRLCSLPDVAYAAPLLLLAASLLELLILVPRTADRVSALTYVVVDSRWWWTLAILWWVAVRLDRRLHGALVTTLRRASAAAPRWAPEAVLATVATTWVVAGTPVRGFSSVRTGDEPKYLRYCENFYQGLGFEMSAIKPIAELGPDYRPPVWRNLTLIAATVPGELREIAADVRAMAGGTTPRARGTPEATPVFIIGRHGGWFQLHNPGLSMLMFPAYYLDRRFATAQPPEGTQAPATLRGVTTFLVGLYVAWVVVVFRFLRRCTGSTGASWMAVLAVVLTLPVAAFPFQVYPEIAAGLMILTVLRAVVFPDDAWRGRWVVVGLAAGYLPWLHVRFSGVMAVLAAAAFVRLRREVGKAGRFAAGLLLPLAALSLYSYQITGSLLPTSLYAVGDAGGALSLAGAWRGSLGYLIDRDWGLFAHSPILLMALPGFYWVARRRPAVAAITTVVLLALLIPAGAYSLVAAGTTPMRLITAVVPLFGVPLAEVFARFGDRRVLRVGAATLLVVSLQTALAYNRHEQDGPLRDSSVSGWKPNVLFPAESRWPWEVSLANVVDWAAWVAAIAALVAAPALFGRARGRGGSGVQGFKGPRVREFSGSGRWASLSAPALAGLAVALFVALGTAVSAATGPAGARYQLSPAEGAVRGAAYLDAIGHCGVCATSGAVLLATTAMLDRLERVDPAVAARPSGWAPRRQYDDWLQMSRQIQAWYVEANGHAPGETDLAHYLYQWREDRVPPEEIHRRIFFAAGKPVPGATGAMEPRTFRSGDR